MERTIWATTARPSSSYRPAGGWGSRGITETPSRAPKCMRDVHDDPQTAIRELLQALELPDRAVTWLRDALVAPEPAGQVH